MKNRGYALFQDDTYDGEGASIKEVDSDDEASVSEENMAGTNLSKGYEYLLGMKIWSLTFERAEELRIQRSEKIKEVQKLQATTPEDIWLGDLDAIESLLDERDTALGVDPNRQQFIQSKIKPFLLAKEARKHEVDVVTVADEVSDGMRSVFKNHDINIVSFMVNSGIRSSQRSTKKNQIPMNKIFP